MQGMREKEDHVQMDNTGYTVDGGVITYVSEHETNGHFIRLYDEFSFGHC